MLRQELIDAQRKLQNTLSGGWLCPFPPSGNCPFCGKDMLERYSEKELRSTFISGCRACNKSFVD